MCQLLGMNCASPTDFTFSFRGFKRRGGETDKHEHGWGLAIYEGAGLRTFLDPLPASKSPVAELVERYPIKTLNMMAHIRYATQGTVSLENVHPFQREMWGIQWCFSHNGEVPKYSNKEHQDYPLLGNSTSSTIYYHAVGDTDSEAVFCAILNALRTEFESLPTLPVLYETIQRLCYEIVAGDEETTIFNFLLGCGPYTLFAYSWPGARPGSTVWNGLHYTIRKPPFLSAKLADVDYAVDFSKVATSADRVAVITTKPLTVDEEWTEFKRGQLLMFDNGYAYSELYDCYEVEQQGRGLCSKAITKECDRKRCSGSIKLKGGPTQRELRYDTPTLLRQLLDEVTFSTVGAQDDGNPNDSSIGVWAKRGADLGCGSGLSGLAIRSCVEHLTGIDLSPEMVDKARNRGCYDRLVIGDMESILLSEVGQGVQGNMNARMPVGGNVGKFDIIFACDVFVYISDLRTVFKSIRDSLSTNITSNSCGFFAFSAEILEDDDDDSNDEVIRKEEKKQDLPVCRPDYVLQSCARFAHERSYICSLATEFGFVPKAMRTCCVLREHDGRGVKRVLAVFSLTKDVR